MRIYIFGIGKGKNYFDRCLLEDVYICGYIDNYKAQEMSFFEDSPVVKQNELHEPYDYIVITLMDYEGVKTSLISEGIREKKIISFFDFKDALNESYWSVLDAYRWRMELMWRHYTGVVMPSIDNIGYELYCDSPLVQKACPKIMDVEHTVAILCREKKCLARFGDNEFELMCGRLRTNYQDVDRKLSEALKKVLHSREDNLLIAIADNYGSLEKYTDDAARDIRMYMTKEIRRDHMQLLELDRQYYDAYLSRPYILYRDKTEAKKKFDQIKKIWNRQDVLIVEGEHTRFGVGNDLLANAKSIKRIVVPDKNAFDRYIEIKAMSCKYGKNKLILAILGPTATVLAYDLAKEGYWIVDIGQLDTEYEWFLCGTEKRCDLKYKTVSEVLSYKNLDEKMMDDNLTQYFDEIIKKI